MHRNSLAVVFSMLCSACGSAAPAHDLGQLSLSLSSEAGGESYRLTEAQFELQGPIERTFSVGGGDAIELSLPIGSYKLSLHDGWSLARIEGETFIPVSASLQSQNPAPLVIGRGATTQVMLRFKLTDGTRVGSARGTLALDVTVADEADAASLDQSTCTHGLILNEVDPEQIGPDDAEFVEILNRADCAADLSHVKLEFVNGGDGKVYATRPLTLAGAGLPAGARLVVGSPNVLASLPDEVPAMSLGSIGLQNGAPDAVRLVYAERVLDALSYEGTVPSAVQGESVGADDGEGSFSRCPDGFDSRNNQVDFRLVPATPGEANACP